MEPNWQLARKRANLEKRARIVQSIRAFFIARDFLEVETPHRIPVNAPETHIDPAPSGAWQLHTSPELCMKRLLAAGYERIFQLCRVWREGERGRLHIPEFSLLEWYRADTDYHDLMLDCEALLRDLSRGGTISRQGCRVDLTAPWERVTVREAFARHASISLDEALATERFDEVISLEIEPHLGRERPTFLIEYPSDCAALARTKPGNPAVAERFELYIAGLELANAFSELTDAQEQRRRFEQDEAKRRANGRPAAPLPEKFLNELAAMPPAAGIALGVDRLIMLLTGAKDIDEVNAFTPESL